MGSYSGVKIYTTLEGRRVRVNRYENGKKVEGIYIDGAVDREDYIFRMLHSEKILGKVWLQRSRPKTLVSRGEDDWVDDFWDDWWDDTFDDDSWYDDSWNDDGWNDDSYSDSWSDDSWYESDNPLDAGNGNFTLVGTDDWGDPIYHNSKDNTYYIDIDGDGFVDSAYVYDGGDIYTPGTGEEENPGDGTMTPPDPDPLPDPGNAPTDSGGEQEGIGGGSGETNNNEEGDESPLPNVKIPYSTSSYPGYIPGKQDCKRVADIIMHQILGDKANIGSSNVYIQLYKEVDGKLTLEGNPNEIFNVLNAHLAVGHPIVVGVNHTINSGINNNDKTTDHWVVVYGRGYDEEKGEYYYNYIETGRTLPNRASVMDDSLRLYYDSEKGTFSGMSWSGKRQYELTQIRPNI